MRLWRWNTTTALEVVTCAVMGPLLWIALAELVQRAGGVVSTASALLSSGAAGATWWSYVRSKRGLRVAEAAVRARFAAEQRCRELERQIESERRAQ